jgi:hypothetical protein
MLSCANGRIEKAGSRFIRILLSRQYTTTLTKIRDQREERVIRKNQAIRSTISCPSGDEQSNVHHLQRHVAIYARSRATTAPTDTSRRHGTGRHSERRRQRNDGRRRANGQTTTALMPWLQQTSVP